MQFSTRTSLLALACTTFALGAMPAGAAEGYVVGEAASAIAADPAVAELVPQAIRDAGVLRISVYGNTPYTMTNESSQLFGAVIDLGSAIAATMGLDAVIEDNSSVAASRVAIESGRYELGMGPFLDSAATEEQFNIINWIKVTPGFVFRAGETYSDPLDFCGKSLAIVSGSVPVERNMEALKAGCAAAGKAEPIVNAYGDQNATIVAVLSGRNDTTVMGSASALYVASTQSDRLAAFSAETDIFQVGVFSGMGMSKQNPELATAVLAAMEKLAADGAYEAIFDAYGLADLLVEDFAINPIRGGL
ncbi:amino acid ABC transporter substrate-binding protein, PAAT family [Devosia enhydra]|uniref:Amino acid ABC transporter substrate-binding protein, PAAT family n=1 Tax=Devosia enhydra TaxID=665118 RepID=A0A1K2HZP7_9HYPH|nr:transporter substrate-binding domain-containing protein [Devosia enhydra]SFZ84693.1 amino acid ABC transporter substrate-binding protein, PAAT family [Devosia enhydra]